MGRIVLKASAGTGKTYRLSLEYLLSLYHGVDYSEIFVMTFTRKATAEIKERILAFAQEILSHSEEGKQILKNIEVLEQKKAKDEGREVLLLEEKLLERAYLQMIKKKENIRVYTIDSFLQILFQRLVAPVQQIYSMKMIENEKEEEVFYRKIVERILSKKENFEKFRSFFALAPKKKLEEYVTLVKTIVQERWKYLLLEEGSFRREEIEVERTAQEIFEEILALFEEMEREKKQEKGHFYTAAFQRFMDLSPEERAKELDRGSIPLTILKLVNGTKTRGKKHEDLIPRVEEIEEKWTELKKSLAAQIFNTEILAYEKQLLVIIEYIYELYDELKWKEKAFSHNDIAIYTYMQLFSKESIWSGEESSRKELSELLECKIEHIFLDEFQDTSILQWRILSFFIEGAKEVICVGDEKQSIYGWRGGEKRLFEHLPSIIAGKEESLNTSYRSIETVVDFCNSFFTSYPKSLENVNWNFENSQANKQERGRVEASFYKEEEEACEALSEWIEDRMQKTKGSLAILARKNKELKTVARYLEEKRIPYELSTEGNYEDEEVVSSFLDLFEYFVTGNYLKLLEFLRSPLMEISTANLKKMIEKKEDFLKYLQLGEGASEFPSYSTKIRSLYQSFQEQEGEIRNSYLEALKLFAVEKKFSKQKNYIDWYRFQEVLASYQTWAEYFLARKKGELVDSKTWEQKENSSFRVQLMSIHKSKGLEFDDVVYIDLSQKKGNDGRNLFFFYNLSEDFKSIPNFFLSSKEYRKCFPHLPAPYSQYLVEEKRKEQEEEINNLYVAWTRPKYNLYFFCLESFSAKQMLEDSVKHYDNPDYFPEGREQAEEREVEGMFLDLFKAEKEYFEDRKQRPVKYSKKVEDHRMEGLMIHFFLEQLLTASEEEIQFARQRTWQEYVSYFGEEKMKQIFSEDRIREVLRENFFLFSSKWDKIYVEYPILDPRTGSKYIIDRMMIEEAREGKRGKVFIVDYKTGGLREEQLQGYADIVRLSLGEKAEDYEFETRYLKLGREGE